jgi:hypothetical protein
MFLLVLFTLVVHIEQVKCQQRKNSPCPLIFTYDTEKDESDRWYGIVKLSSSVPLYGISVDIILDRTAVYLGAYYFEGVSTRDHKEFRIENQNFKLDPGRTLVMNIYVNYQGNVQPRLKQIRLNGQNVCVDLPSVSAVQPIYNPLSNSNSNSPNEYDTTKKTTRRENPNYK